MKVKVVEVELTFNDVKKMFNELIEKGYSPEEILKFPIFVGKVKGGAKWMNL